MSAEAPSDRALAPWGLYLHVPFCRIRCPYCAFDIAADHEPRDDDAFVDRLLAEVEARAAAFRGPRRTVYIGGGTPSRLALPALTRLLRAARGPETREVTVEANPEDVTPAWVDAILRAGVTRVSLGVQTLDPATAGRIARRASARLAPQAAATLRAAGVGSWSADLMFGLPGQTHDAFDADLEALLRLEPPHVSVYGLTVEPNTGFQRAARAGRLPLPDEDTWAEMFDHLGERLLRAGLARYEVSNFARAGHESDHNAGYWDDRPYLGVGPSAHSDLPDDTRTVDVAGFAAWSAATDRVASRERTTPEARARDLLVAGLRAATGLPRARLRARTGYDVDDDALRPLLAQGLLADDPDALRLGPRGWALADRVTAWLDDHLHPVANSRPSR
jgi:oxygen-independent coproporphyrinogen-3 oxidase